MEAKTNEWVLDKIGPGLLLGRSTGERNLSSFIFKMYHEQNSCTQRLIQGKVECK